MIRKHKRPFPSCTVLINPSRYPEYVRKLKRILREAEMPEIIESRDREHFIASVRRFYRGPNRYLLIWGGDGTAHDAINAFMDASVGDGCPIPKKSIGFLRGGSGNGIQDSYEVPFSIRDQVRTFSESIRGSCVLDVDLIQAHDGNRSRFCQLAGFGFDAHVLTRREERRYRSGPSRGQVKRGLSNYIVSVTETYLHDYDRIQRNFILRLHDGKFAYRGTRINAEFPFERFDRPVSSPMVELGTRPYYGKLFKVCPDVVCNDGFLDIYVYNFENRLSIARNALSVWTGRHDRINKRFARSDRPLIERYEVRRVEVVSPMPFAYHIDGELKRKTESDGAEYRLTFEIVPRCISFIVPGTFYRKFHPFDESAS